MTEQRWEWALGTRRMLDWLLGVGDQLPVELGPRWHGDVDPSPGDPAARLRWQIDAVAGWRRLGERYAAKLTTRQ